MHEEYIAILKKNGWLFEQASNSKNKEEVQDYASGRLKEIDETLFDFLNSYELLANQEDTVWYIPLNDYSKETSSEEEFNWNDFEVESLEYADDDEERKEINEFWSSHLPFLFSVKNGYAFIAVALSGENKGKIVYGREPMYEDIDLIADSLGEFQKMHKEAISGDISSTKISDFI